MFDEALGFAQLAPGFTAYLHVNYRRPTPLNTKLDIRAWVDSVDGRKRLVKGECRQGDVLLSDAEGLFIAPRAEIQRRPIDVFQGEQRIASYDTDEMLVGAELGALESLCGSWYAVAAHRAKWVK